MSKYGWKDGRLLNHIHGKWGFKDASTMECLASGSDGVWAAVCEEGAAVGHTSSTVAILNLIRHGNTNVLSKYNCMQLRKAAIEVTQLTTKSMPHPKQIIYGERATDVVLADWGYGEFDIGEFFGFKGELRITTVASPDMILDRLKDVFGDDEPQFNEKIAHSMKEHMLQDLRLGFKHEYHSEYGIAMLFDRSGGVLTEEMKQVLTKVESKSEIHNAIKNEIKKLWNKYVATGVIQNSQTQRKRILKEKRATARLAHKTQRRNLLSSFMNNKSNSISKSMTSKLSKIRRNSKEMPKIDENDHDDKFKSDDDSDDNDNQKRLAIGYSSNSNSRSNYNPLNLPMLAEFESLGSNLNKRPGFENYRSSNTPPVEDLTFDQFYHGFMQPYFGCYRCQFTKEALYAIDMNDDGTIAWDEFCVYVDWTLREYHDEIRNTSQCLDLVFEKGIIPAMREEMNEIKHVEISCHRIEPKNYLHHTASVIFLHGIGDFDEIGTNSDYWFGKFAQSELIKNSHKFDHIKFIFPTADKRDITDKNGGMYNAWCDVALKPESININNNNGNNNDMESTTLLDKSTDEKADLDVDHDDNTTDLKIRATLRKSARDSNTDRDVSTEKSDYNRIKDKYEADGTGMLRSIHQIEILVKEEIHKFGILPQNIMLCGYNQGAMVALKTGLKIQEIDEIGGVICLSGLLPAKINGASGGEGGYNIDKSFLDDLEMDDVRALPIYWCDSEYVRVYQETLGNEFGKKCFDYLKGGCQLNAHYETYNENDLKDIGKILKCIAKRLPRSHSQM